MFRAGRRKFSEGIKGEVRRNAGAKLPTMPASSSRALTRSEADLLIAQMQEQLRLMQAARPATPAPETQPDPREESGSESESSESEEEEKRKKMKRWLMKNRNRKKWTKWKKK